MVRQMIKILIKLMIVTVLIVVAWYFVLDNRQESIQLTDEVRQTAPGQFAELEHGWVHYQLHGADTASLIVLIHGGGITGMEVWQKNMDYFINQGYRVLAFDLYGRGYSARPKLNHTPCMFHDQLAELLVKLEIKSTYHLVALSMGAIIALDFQKSHFKQVQKMVLIDPAASGNYRVSHLLKIPVLSNFLMTVYWYPRAVENQRKEFVDQEQFEVYARSLRHFMSYEGYKHTNYSTWMHLLNQTKMELLNKVDPSQLLVIYGAQDPYFNAGQVNLFRTEVPLVRIMKVDSAGHLPQYEKPDQVNRLIDAFLQGNLKDNHSITFRTHAQQ